MHEESDPNHFLKKLIWICFFLWAFEGALRKWFLPFLSTPLLIVRDPIVLWLVILSIRRGLLKANIYLTGMVILGIVSFFTAIFFAHGNIYVAVYGVRPMLLYFPLVFITGRVFNREDVIQMGKAILIISIPMTILLVLQFYSPQSAWVNRGVGGDESGAGFGGAMGFLRPPGTFSFTNGIAFFYSMAAPFILFFWFHPHYINKKVQILATFALVVAIPISISRGLFFQVAVSIIFLLIWISRKPQYFGKIFLSGFILAVILTLFGNFSFFNTATDAFSSRFENANRTEGGLVQGVLGNRFLGSLIKGITGTADQPILGYGAGIGTSLGLLLLNDDRVLLKADFEWMRQIGELGIMGLFVIALRVGLAAKIGIASYQKMKRNDVLPWLITSVAIVTVIQGQWHQPTALGFFALIGGLLLASLKTPKRIETNIEPVSQETVTLVSSDTHR